MDNKKAKKIYDKAVKYYQSGDLDDALKICEKSISKDIKNPALLNLKGLILYQRGDLNKAITTWKVNADYNKDMMANNYINDAYYDKDSGELYVYAERLIKNLRVDDAIKILKKCSKSDFNCINVNSALAMAYQRKGEFEKASEFIEKALKVDKNNPRALKIKKDLKTGGLSTDSVYEEKSHKARNIFIIMLVLLIIGGLSYFVFLKYSVKIDKKENTEKITVDEDVTPKVETNIDTQEQENEDSYGFDKEKITSFINDKDFNSLYDSIKTVNESDLKSEDDKVYKDAVNMLKTEGVKNFYDDGRQYYNDKKYDDAVDSLKKAYDYKDGNYLAQHIIFYYASSLLEQGKNDEALGLYNDYYKAYPKGPYIEGVLYQLTLLNSGVDDKNSKAYAKTLIEKYPESTYINDTIKQIANS
ncbi:tetratricopeptide repeat protein [Clostridium sp. BJN0001]|uniref:tetratricopeptide repeat protein n=1 Tax=Clostridium sp. BJN0001 TaxID=2930219 RepID=UPI001FCFDBF3|nr:tetratricopeptide repeat protein [Clostridium sp. BJN0001]